MNDETDWDMILFVIFFVSVIISGIFGIFTDNFILRLYSGIGAFIIFAMFLQPMGIKIVSN